MSNVTPMGANMPTPWSGRQLATIKQTVAKDTDVPNGEFDLFMEYCRAKGLDPFVRQAIAIVFNKNEPDKRQMTIITTQDGLRVMAARCGDYGPDRTKPEYEYDSALKSPTNPLGIVSCAVTLWKQDKKTNEWHPVVGVAYWDEFVPIKKAGSEGFEWEETGEVYPEGHAKAGKKKFRKKLIGEISETIDDSGQWAKMPRNQIAKCARMQALRGGWPETFSGTYAEEEMDRAVAAERSASELLEDERVDRRMKQIGAAKESYAFSDQNGDISYIPAGQFGDRMREIARKCQTIDEFNTMDRRNKESMRLFWANHKAEALDVKEELDNLAEALEKKHQPKE